MEEALTAGVVSVSLNDDRIEVIESDEHEEDPVRLPR
jgi:hypothetical protein